MMFIAKSRFDNSFCITDIMYSYKVFISPNLNSNCYVLITHLRFCCFFFFFLTEMIFLLKSKRLWNTTKKKS